MATRKKGKVQTEHTPDHAPDHAPDEAKTIEAQETSELAAAGFPIVGIGASAGGLAAFEDFFCNMPTDIDPGMAFVLVQHLAPDHKSILSDLIRRYTRMQVFEVEDGVTVQVNCAYIIPPNRDMAFLNGTLQLLEPAAPRGHRLPIDFFFRSLARDQRERAICIVLSGTGSDGTLGLRAIKDEGGMAMAQSPDSTEFDSMPRSVIATGLVDYVLPPAEMPAQLIAYNAHAYGHRPQQTTADATPKIETALKKIFILLRAQTGHDFSQYKPSTINRRIERRMAVHQIEAMDGYVRYLQQTPAEVEALFRDLLIGVTSFFRDPAAFQALETRVISKLFDGKREGTPIRIWSSGCSTGEEAYSFAILLQEQMETLKQTHKVQVFATDIDSRAIATARIGIYPASIAADLSPERLARFFTVEGDGSTYRIHKNIRDRVIFSEQDMIKDPPFSKLDLVSCRNVLIYMDGDLQKRLISLFHYALKPGGILFLGNSETVGENPDLFSTLDNKWKLYQRKHDIHGAPRAVTGRMIPPKAALESGLPYTDGKAHSPVKVSLRTLTEQAILKHLALSGALVNGQGDILYLHGRTGLYLEPAPGEAGVSNILKMAREGLRRDLTTALHKAAGTKDVVYAPNLRIKTNGHFTTINLFVSSLAAGTTTMIETPLYLVIMEETPAAGSPAGPMRIHEPVPLITLTGTVIRDEQPPAWTERSPGKDDSGFDRLAVEAMIAALHDELRANKEHLQAANEELESANEELKSSNEEMQSVNEELQSTNEELETSKEEMQSINEELATVNAELETKVADLSRASNDMNNLLAGNDIGTIFVDYQLCILRFTPAATRIINMITSDVGRPVAHFVSNLVGYNRLVADAQDVLNTLVPKVVDVQTTEGAWYTMRIRPYRTINNVIEGAVITFMDITEMVQTREALRKANELLRLAVVVRDAHDAITVQDVDGRILAWNPSAVRMYGWSETEALIMNIRDRIPPESREQELTKVHQLDQDKILEPYRTHRLTKDGATVEVLVTSTALVNLAGQRYAIATTERAIQSQAGRTKEERKWPA